MARFSKHADFYSTSIITGPSSCYVRLRLTQTTKITPAVQLLQPDSQFGNASSEELLSQVVSTINSVNTELGTSYAVEEICYQTDNDSKYYLVTRAVRQIVLQHYLFGDLGFELRFQKIQDANERWKGATQRRCPQCSALCPEFRARCIVCEYELGRLPMFPQDTT